MLDRVLVVQKPDLMSREGVESPGHRKVQALPVQVQLELRNGGGEVWFLAHNRVVIVTEHPRE